MITDTDKIDVERSGEFEEGTFRISNNREMFDALSSALYTNKIAAVLREISINAFDSNIQAGKKDKPIKVKLPDRFDNELRISDEGLGLTDEDIKEVYSVYGESTKRNTNNLVGTFGVGAKSPFCIEEINGFMVVSKVCGKKSTYSVFRNEEGLPAYAKLTTEQTDESNGVEIIVGIPNASIYEWQKEAVSIFKWFDVKPDITPKITFPQENKIFEGSNFYLYTDGNTSYYPTKKLIALMGSVAYEFTWDKLPECLTQHSVLFRFSIGELDVALSRERLQMTKKTKEAIQNRINEALVEITKVVEAKINGAKSAFEASALLRKNSFAVKSATWNGKVVSTNSIDLRTIKNKLDCRHLYNAQMKRIDHIWPEVGLRIFYNDLERGGLATLRREGQENDIYLSPLNQEEIVDATGAVISKASYGMTKLEIAAYLGLNESDFLLTSSFPKPVIVRAKRGSSAKIQKYKFCNAYTQRDNWEDATVQVSDTIYYVDIKDFQPIIDQSYGYKAEKLIVFVNWLRHFNLIPVVGDIYGCRPTVSEKMKKGWLNIGQVFKDNYERLYVSEDIESCERDASSTFWEYQYLKPLYGKGLQNKELISLRDDWENLLKRVERDRSKLTAFKNLPIIKEVAGTDFSERLNRVWDKWPLMHHINNTRWHVTEVIDYLNK